MKEVELGAKVGETCRKHRVSEPTYYKWKNPLNEITVPHLSQLRELQEENAKLKRMYADLALLHLALKDVVDRVIPPISTGPKSRTVMQPWPDAALE